MNMNIKPHGSIQHIDAPMHNSVCRNSLDIYIYIVFMSSRLPSTQQNISKIRFNTVSPMNQVVCL